MSGLYIHIPFCKQHCHYCNFHFATSLRDKEAMLDAIQLELAQHSASWGHPIKTIYFGGGTPSLLSIQDISQLLDTVRAHFMIDPEVEITLEANPDDMSPNYIKGLSDLPIHRLSLGVQSLHESDLRYMHRAHNSQEALTALHQVMAADFRSVSLDLIYGLSILTDEAWMANLDAVIDLGVPHLSCYQLTIEPGTPLQSFIDRGTHQAADDAHVVRQFDLLLDRMDNAGYECYEISNYALPGHRSLHNGNYWQGVPYLGIGPSAHSYDGRRRWWNTVVNRRYIEDAPNGTWHRTYELIDDTTRYNEYVLIQLRRIEGLDTAYMKDNWPKPYTTAEKVLLAYEAQGWLETTASGYRLSRAGKHWADRISMELMEV